MWTVPNILTYLRILLIPAFVLVFYLPFNGNHLVCMFIFILAAITDILDGYVARHLKQISKFGAFLDPVADKLMVAAALILLVGEYHNVLISILGLVIVSREITISALREWMAELGQHTAVKVGSIGKVKTTVQMVAIIVLLAQPAVWNTVSIIGVILLTAAVVLTLWSMVNYLVIAYRTLSGRPL